MIDGNGEEWLTVEDAARRLRVLPGTIKVWRTRGKVRGHGRGAAALVNVADVADAELAWRRRLATRRTTS